MSNKQEKYLTLRRLDLIIDIATTFTMSSKIVFNTFKNQRLFC